MITSPFLLLICKVAGTMLAVVSLILTVQFGLTISVGIAAALAVVSVMASYIWPIAIECQRNAGSGWAAGAVKAGAVVVAIGVTMIDGITNSSTTGTHRLTDVHVARVQTANATNVTGNLESARATLAMQKRRLADMTKSNGWNASVTPIELQARLETAEKAVAWEERRGGCGPKCLALKSQRDQIASTIGSLTEHNKLVGMIAATQAHIETLTKQVAETPPQVSSVDTQNKKLASLFTLDRNPGEGSVYWTDTWMMVAIGLIITLASQFFNMLAWLPPANKRDDTHAALTPTHDRSAPNQYLTVNTTADSSREIARAISNILNGPSTA